MMHIVFLLLALPALSRGQLRDDAPQSVDLQQMRLLLQQSLARHTERAVESLPPVAGGLLDQLMKLRPSEERAILLYEMVSGKNVSSQIPPLSEAEMAPLKVAVEASILSIIEEIIEYIIKVIKSKVDTISLGSFATNLTSEAVQGEIRLSNLNLSHLTETRALRYDVNLLNLCAEVDVLLPDLLLTGNYDVQVTANLSGSSMDVYGNGTLRLDISTTYFHGALCLRFPSRRVALRVEDLQLSVSKTEITLTNLFYDSAVSKLISGIATDVGPSFVAEYQSEVMDIIMEKLNEVL